MAKWELFFSILCFLLLGISCQPSSPKQTIPVGVILDLNSKVGKIAERCIHMALSDFYTVNSNYQTRLALSIRNSGTDVVTAASAALDLMENEVHAIVGPQWSSQAMFVIKLGQKAKIPIISFSATTPPLSPSQSPFFIRTAQNDSAQVKAIKAIVETYGWREIILIYEDTEYGRGLIPYLLDAFQEIHTLVPYRSVIPSDAKDATILNELNNLKEKHKIFLVHMTASLGSKLFLLAKNAGMMEEGYAWIVTEGLSNILDPVSSQAMGTMQGVLGIRPHIPSSEKLVDFKTRWNKDGTFNEEIRKTTEINLFGLWAYDTIWALAMAAEKAGLVHTNFTKQNATRTDVAALRISEQGPKLLNTLLKTNFEGIAGNFSLVGVEREASAFQIFNVIGETERIIGYWSPKVGLSRYLDNTANSNGKDKLKQPLWPGDTLEQPTKLRIGVPVRQAFTEFLKVEWDSRTGHKPQITGFCKDVFDEVLKAVPFPLPYEFVPFANGISQAAGTYDELVCQIPKKFDAVVGDITIISSRSSYVDFTLPYSESDVSMVVSVKDDERKNMWVFLKPLSWDLWLTIALAFIFTGLVVWVLEHRVNTEFRGPPGQQLGTIFWFSFSTLVFSHREKVVNNFSRLVLIIWFFVVLIITQSYTASLASLLTVQRLQPAYLDITEIKKNGYYVGYQKQSFVKRLLTEQLKFNESMLKAYVSPEDYHEALSRGTFNGGVAAIFDEIPYIKLFLAKYSSKYTMAGPIYKTGGLGFAFPQGSPLVSHISRAILNVTEDKAKMDRIYKNLGSLTACENQGATISSSSLSVYSFAGLFIITGVASMFSLLIYVLMFLRSHWTDLDIRDQKRPLWSKIVELANHFDKKDHLHSHPVSRNLSRVHPRENSDDAEISPPDRC